MKTFYKLYNEETKEYVSVAQYVRVCGSEVAYAFNKPVDAHDQNADIVFNDPVDAHCAAYDMDDAENIPINVVSFNDNGVIC